ncbi:hypothetical protein Hanom_Chr00s000050g01617661 [Helianthus anomalus]
MFRTPIEFLGPPLLISITKLSVFWCRDELGTVRYRTGTGTESTGTENPQKWVPVPVPNIPGTVRFGTGTGSVPVRYRYLRGKTGKYRYRTGTVPDRYRTGTENVKSRYRIGTEKIPGSVNSVPVPVRYRFGTGTGSILLIPILVY